MVSLGLNIPSLLAIRLDALIMMLPVQFMYLAKLLMLLNNS